MKKALVVMAALLLPAAAFASGGGEGHEGMSLMDWGWRIMNFAILLVLLVKFVGKPLREFLQQRKELIAKSISEAKEAKELAAKALSEVEERLKVKDKEIADIIASAQESGERERGRLIEEGERMAVRVAEQAKTNIDFELKRAKEVIQAEAVAASLELAEKKIKDRLTKEGQDKLLQESIKLIEGRN
ncbi:MAG TPA: F0F1 ATP synthase subunit B [Dissulfurispiraceae bacterium]|nr:F0F1 ATP synthase subunit B [Dissulfurispiraceae bacterium]